MNFLASNISQVLAGAIELGLGFLLPFQLLLVVGVEPAVAGLALLPASVPIILVGPLAGRAYDRFGGRWPLVAGYLVLVLSGLALAVGVSDQTAVALFPGLVLQGIGLGIVLTVNDPVGLSSVPQEKGGEAAGMINTAEQLGGAIGIAGFLALEYRYYLDRLYASLDTRGIEPTQAQIETGREYMLRAEQAGLHNVPEPGVIREVFSDITAAHVDGFQLAFGGSAIVAAVGVVVCLVLVRHGDPVGMPIRSRRSRWILANLDR
jgi:MFS family permease